MITFIGELSDENKIFISKLKAIKSGIVFSICSFVFSILLIVYGVYSRNWYYSLVFIFILFLLSISFFLVPKNRIVKITNVIEITINKDKINYKALTIGQNYFKSKSINKVKKIIDYEKFYCIIFKLGDITNAWVCQKNLITHGTIQEFEEIFKDKIRKPKRRNK